MRFAIAAMYCFVLSNLCFAVGEIDIIEKGGTDPDTSYYLTVSDRSGSYVFHGTSSDTDDKTTVSISDTNWDGQHDVDWLTNLATKDYTTGGVTSTGSTVWEGIGSGSNHLDIITDTVSATASAYVEIQADNDNAANPPTGSQHSTSGYVSSFCSAAYKLDANDPDFDSTKTQVITGTLTINVVDTFNQTGTTLADWENWEIGVGPTTEIGDFDFTVHYYLPGKNSPWLKLWWNSTAKVWAATGGNLQKPDGGSFTNVTAAQATTGWTMNSFGGIDGETFTFAQEWDSGDDDWTVKIDVDADVAIDYLDTENVTNGPNSLDCNATVTGHIEVEYVKEDQ